MGCVFLGAHTSFVESVGVSKLQSLWEVGNQDLVQGEYLNDSCSRDPEKDFQIFVVWTVGGG